MKKHLFIACCCCLAGIIHGWSQAKREILAPVLRVDTNKAGKPMGVALSAYSSFLAKGMRGTVVKRYNGETGTDTDTEVGVAEVVLTNDSMVAFTVTYSEAYQQAGMEENDQLKMLVADTLFSPDHLTGHILALQLQLLNQDRNYFFSQHWLKAQYVKDPEATEQWLIDTLLHDLQTFYAANPEIFEGDLFQKTITKGRYKGSTPQKIFAQTTEEDIRSFLWFMISYPGKYIGIPYKFNETYATWLINDGLFGGYEIIQWYHAAGKDSVQFVNNLKSVPGVLTEKDLSYNIGLTANTNAYWGQDRANEDYRAARIYSAISGDYEGAGLTDLFYAEWLHKQKNDYSGAVPYCYRAADFFARSDNNARILDALSKASYCHYSVSSYDSSFAALQSIRQILTDKRATLDSSSQAAGWRKYYEYNAYTYYKAGRFNEAITYLDTAIARFSQMDYLQAAPFLAYDYSLQGKILKNKELYEKALVSYDSSIYYYEIANDFTSMGISANDKAVVLFNQGKYKESNALLRKCIEHFEGLKDYDNAGFSYSQTGQNYWNLYQYDSAIDAHRTAIRYRQRSNNISGEAFSWEQLGTLYQRAGLKPQALQALDSASALYEVGNERAELAEVLLEAGKVYENDKENAKAESYYKKASNTLASLGNKAGYADALFKLGLLVFEDRPEAAEQYMDSCRILSLEAGLSAQAAYAMMNLGALNKYKGNLAEGKSWYQQAKKIIDKLDEPHARAHYYRNLGSDAEWELNLDSANNCFARAMQIFDSTDMKLSLQTRMRIAYNLQNMGKYAAADSMIDIVLTEATKGNYLLELGSAYQNKAWAYLQQGQIEKGLPLADSASKYYEASGNTNSLASIYSLRGEFVRKQFNFKDAYTWYNRADSIWSAGNNWWNRSSGMINFIVLFYYQGDYRTSQDYTYKALAARPFLLEDQLYLDLQACLAENYYYLGLPDSANYFLDKYIPLAREKKLSRSNNWLSLIKGRMLVDNKQFAAAIPFLQVATSPEAVKNDLIIYQQALPYLGMAYSGLGKKDSADLFFAKAVAVARFFELPSFSWEALYLAGLDAYNNNEYEKSIPLFKQSVALVNKQAANLYGGEEAGKLFRQQPTKSDLYFKLMSALTKTGRKDEAWQYANLSQAAAVSDLAGGLSAELANPDKAKALQEAQAKFQQIQSVGSALQESKKDSVSRAGQIAVLEKTKAIAEEEYLNYIEKLKKDYPELGTFFANQVNPENFRNLHGYLPEDMAMLMYVINDKELMIFWATTDNTGIVTGTIPDNFYEQVDAWLVALKNPARPAGAGPLVLRTQLGKLPTKAKPTISVKDGAEQLYQLLIAPVYAEIKDKASWCVIPNGKLTHLPFHVLGTSDSTGKFEYLAAAKNIFYTNKPNELFLPWTRRNKQSFAALGNPDQTLNSAGEEVREIAKVYPATAVYTEGQATVEKASQSLSGMQYVHFATHGVLSYPDFDSSYLVFAPGADQPNAGHLTLYDIRRLNIKGCDLVTLSACETAVSSEISKGWYVSPANAFLINKVRSVVASLWEVDDKSTSMLMQRFYTHLQTMPKVQALRQAMSDVSAVPEFEHPFYWSAFVLYGDWQ